jgi:tRNA(Arg) A34 adenosine deaminase TadA
MTGLELTLANILQSIAIAQTEGNTSALAALVQRKNTICAALAAPEQSWHAPQTHAPMHARRQCESREKTQVPMLATSPV